MKQDRTESFESPLDEVLEDIPQEDPPEDLEQRCLDALGNPASESKPSQPTWWLPVRNVIAAAAALVLVVGAVSMMGPGLMSAQEKARGTASDQMMAPPPGSGAISSEAPQMMAEEAAPEPGRILAMEPGTPASPQADRVMTGAEDEESVRRTAYDEDAAEPRATTSYNTRIEAPPAPRGDAADIVAGAPRVPAEQPRAPEVEDPWRDFSGVRQVVTTKELDMEVGDVEEAYDDVRSIVSKHGGFIASDHLQIAEDRADEAHLTIRLPVGNFESAITDLRQLGEVTRLVGESVDVTEQYYEEGADIREKADREQWLMDRLDNARTERERQQLKHQIEQLRREMGQEKEILGRLAEQTHWPVLELTLTEASSPGEFLSRTLGGSLKVLAWVGATAIIWVPLVILLTLFWRRLTPRAPSE